MVYNIIYLIVAVVTRIFLLPGISSSAFFNRLYSDFYFLGKQVIERKTQDEIEKLIRPGMTVVDVGANVGYYTLLLSQWVGPGGKVCAFEPDPFLFKILVKNINRHKLRNIEAFEAAVSNESGEATLFRSKDNLADNRICRVEENRAEFKVKSYSLDDFFSHRSEKPAFIKMDIQGAEPYALGGMRKLIADSKQLVLVSEFAPDWIQNGGTAPIEYLRQLKNNHLTIKELGQSRTLSSEEDFSALIQKVPGGRFTDVICEVSH